MPTNFLWSTSPFTTLTVASTELVSLANGSFVTPSTLGPGANGIYTSSMYGQAMLADIFVLNNSSIAPTSGANWCGWFFTSSASGGSFETTSAATLPPVRPPDFIVPVQTTLMAAATIFKSAGPVQLPALPFKVGVGNNLGITAGTSTTFGFATVTIVPYTWQY